MGVDAVARKSLSPGYGGRRSGSELANTHSTVVADWAVGDKVTVTWTTAPGTIEELPCDLGLFLVRFGPESTAEVCVDDMTRIAGER